MTPTLVPPASARAFELDAGWAIRITDPAGSQVGDLLFVAREDTAERFSQSRTRVYHERVGLRVGDGLWSTRDRVLLRLEHDTVGVHDLLFCGCSRAVFEQFLDRPGRTGCLDHLAAALAPYGVSSDSVESPLDLFMHTEVAPDGSLIIHRSPSLPGDHVILRAEADLVVALAACADDVTDCNGGQCGPLVVELLPPAPTLERSSSEPPTRAA